jgi:hypothetical protein
MLREATNPPAAVNVLDVSSESMAAFQVFMYGRFWVFTEGIRLRRRSQRPRQTRVLQSKGDCDFSPAAHLRLTAGAAYWPKINKVKVFEITFGQG